jgi:hypothetical protein
LAKQKKNIWKLISIFRESVYFSDVLRQLYRVSHAHRYLPQIAIVQSETEFIETLKLLLEDTTMLKPKTIDPILESNSTEQIQNAILSSLSGVLAPMEIYGKLHKLAGAGPFFVSSLLAIATDGDYIIYEKRLLEGMKEIAPEISEGMKKVDDAETYFDFMNACRTMKESFGFTSYAELHEFLWHGQYTKWLFKKQN